MVGMAIMAKAPSMMLMAACGVISAATTMNASSSQR